MDIACHEKTSRIQPGFLLYSQKFCPRRIQSVSFENTAWIFIVLSTIFVIEKYNKFPSRKQRLKIQCLSNQKTTTIQCKQEKEVKFSFLFRQFLYKKGKTLTLNFSLGMSSGGRTSQEKEERRLRRKKAKKKGKKEEEEEIIIIK